MNSTNLGDFLKTMRKSRGLTLRQVEEATEKEISNAYLSQLETGKISKPSPNVLHTLANLYAAEFQTLMEKAGYLMSQDSRNDDEKHGKIATNSLGNLTREEEDAMLEYLAFIRSKKGKK